MGLGYVGLPLALEFVRAGYQVVGLDADDGRVRRMRDGQSYITDVADGHLREALDTGRFHVTTDPDVLAEVQTVNICVPTPLSKSGDPDLSYVQSAVQSIASNQQRGQLYILESTTYPGTTEEALLPVLSRTGYQVGEDFFLAFSPERVDPGNPQYNTRNIPKVVGGMTARCSEVAAALYSNCIESVVTVSSPRVAEMVKLLENTYRSVNIGLVNELARMCHKLGVDIWEVIDAAKTKPFGFMPFYPGPGLGGHCIPIDPIYLSWKARQVGFEAQFISLASKINISMPQFVVDLVLKALNDRGKALNGARIFLVGVAYKAGVSDIRESPALDVWHLLSELGAQISYHDPHVPELEFLGRRHVSQAVEADSLRNIDCAVILTAHGEIDLALVREHAPCIVDTRNAYPGARPDGRLYKL
ncbi:MAG: nucleotide sugar dehydrogenase [Candidatus Tectomicrobia bacterium]|uniref:Nucleotide sugar dehydrogenase n=1 Tax=Tectimicrobiota bacterium TaxID=2528274 RepID=A0A932HY44_UNCTE|nr:nucleotide sugar dehydrogenase [Candidatus Tectomicrobia bacterium]